jgi:hypothetical protein
MGPYYIGRKSFGPCAQMVANADREPDPDAGKLTSSEANPAQVAEGSHNRTICASAIARQHHCQTLVIVWCPIHTNNKTELTIAAIVTPDHSRGLLATAGIPGIAAIAAILASGYDGGPAGGPGAGVSAGPWVPSTGRRNGFVLVRRCQGARRCAARPG